MKTKYKAAAVLAYPVFLDIEATVAKVCRLIDEAAGNGADLVVFPETFIPCYPWWIWMAVNSRKRAEFYVKLYDNSADVYGGPFLDVLTAAKKNGIHVVIGISEKDGGTLYNTQVFINDEGKMIGKRRKLVPTNQERTLWGMGDGSDLIVLDTKLGKIGGLICYENSMALSRYALYAMGEQIHIANWPGAYFRHQPRDIINVVSSVGKCVAFEGQVFQITSTSTLSKEEADFYLELDPTNQGILEPGGGLAVIIDPFANYVSEPISDVEGITYGEIDLNKIRLAKLAIDTVGHYARWDVTRLILNREKNVPFVDPYAFNAGKKAQLIELMDRISNEIDNCDKTQIKTLINSMRQLV